LSSEKEIATFRHPEEGKLKILRGQQKKGADLRKSTCPLFTVNLY
jgi:hypothetical protein